MTIVDVLQLELFDSILI